jgi:AraC-like DNA-binding protein
MKDMLPFWSNREIYKEARIIVIRIFFAMASMVTFTAGFFCTNSLIMLIGGSISATIQISILITQDYYPAFFFAIRKEMRRKRYEHSLLNCLNTGLIKQRLEELMDDEQVYKDMELNLNTLAQKLSISSHQLSQFLNDQLQVNFRNYVNGYRIRAAERMLKENPSMNISAICYEVGFNSKSTFYTLFKEQTGKTPLAYRDDMAATKKAGK